MAQLQTSIPLNTQLHVEPNERSTAADMQRIKVSIVEHWQRKEPFGPCYVLWFSFEKPNSKGAVLLRQGYLWGFGYGPEPTWCREWKTLKGIVQYFWENCMRDRERYGSAKWMPRQFRNAYHTNETLPFIKKQKLEG